MRCHNCNKEFADHLNYCPYCGSGVRRAEPARREPPAGVRRVSLNLSPAMFEQPEEEPSRPAPEPPKPAPRAGGETGMPRSSARPAPETRRPEIRPSQPAPSAPSAVKPAEARPLSVKPAAAAPAGKPAEKPALKPVEKPAEKVAVKPLVTPADKPTAKSAEKPAEKPAVKPLATPADKPAAKPAEKPIEKTAVKPLVTPADKPAAKPVERSAEKPVEKPAVKPAEKPAEKPAQKPVAKPSEATPERPATGKAFGADVKGDSRNETGSEKEQAVKPRRLAEPAPEEENEAEGFDTFKEKFAERMQAFAAALGLFFAKVVTGLKKGSAAAAVFFGKLGAWLAEAFGKIRAYIAEQRKRQAERRTEKAIREAEQAEKRLKEEAEAKRREAEKAEAEAETAGDEGFFDAFDETPYEDAAPQDGESDFIPASAYFDYTERGNGGSRRPEPRAEEAGDYEGRAPEPRGAREEAGRYRYTVDDVAARRREWTGQEQTGHRPSRPERYERPERRDYPQPQRMEGRRQTRRETYYEPEQRAPYYPERRPEPREGNEPLRYDPPARYFSAENAAEERDSRDTREIRDNCDSRELNTPRRLPSSYRHGASRTADDEVMREIGAAEEVSRNAGPRVKRQAPRHKSALRNAAEWLLIRVRPIHIAILAGVLIVILGFVIIKNMGSPTKAFEEALNNRNYEAAAALYTNQYKGKEALEASSEAEFAAYLNSLKQHALEGKSTYSATNAALDVIKSSALYTGKYKELVDQTAQALVVLQQADVLFHSAKDKMNNLNFEQAIVDFNQVLELYPGFPGTAELLATCRDRYREVIIREVGVLQSQSKFKDADKRIGDALKLIPDDPVLEDLKKSNSTKSVSSLYQATLNSAERYFQSGDFANVFKVIAEAQKKDPGDESIATLKGDFETRCAENILNAADNIFLQGNRDEAIKKLQEGLKLLPDNKLLKDSLTRYQLNSGGTEASAASTASTAGSDESQTAETTARQNEEDIKDNMDRTSMEDAGGREHKDAVVKQFKFTGDTSIVDQVVFPNKGNGARFTGEMALGRVNAYTQVYYQVYSSDNQASPLLVGSLSASSGSEPGDSYKISVDLPANGADSFIVNLNYLQGGKIDVILDLHFTR